MDSLLNLDPVTALLIGVAGGFGFLFGLFQLWEASKTEAWDTTEGEIILSVLEDHYHGRIHPNDDIITFDDQDNHRLRFAYAYEVAGKRYIGRRVRFDRLSRSGREAHYLAKRYQQGERIPVYFNPAAPDEAVLEPGVRWGDYFPLFVSLTFLALGLVNLFFYSA